MKCRCAAYFFARSADLTGMELGVLGPVALWVDGAAVEVGPPRQQAILAALAVDTGRPVTVDALVERVWGPRAQPAARSGLYSYLTRLRRVVAGAGLGDAMRLVSRPGGYVLEMDPDRVDVCRFRRLVRAARAVEDDRRRADLLAEAVGLWRGAALAGLPADWAARTRQLLDREYLDAILLWAQAELRLGGAGLVTSTLRKLVDQYPLVEPLAGRLIEALARDGRTAEALECYATTRRQLTDRLGIEPGVELRRVHHAVLTGAFQQAAWSGYRPGQLRGDVAGFTGRDAELATLDAILASAPRHFQGVPVAAICGAAGVGKTALAVHWAHRVAAEFPDGQLYVNLHGDQDGPPLAPAEALDWLLASLGVPRGQVPAGLAARVALYRTLLAGQRVLLLLDNARDTAQVRPLLPGNPGCVVLVTSRRHLTGLVATDGAHTLFLGS